MRRPQLAEDSADYSRSCSITDRPTYGEVLNLTVRKNEREPLSNNETGYSLQQQPVLPRSNRHPEAFAVFFDSPGFNLILHQFTGTIAAAPVIVCSDHCFAVLRLRRR